MKKIVLVAFASTALALGACSSKEKKETSTKAETSSAAQASVEAKEVAYEQQAAYVTELSFKKGSAGLTTDSQKKLGKLLADAKAAGNVSELKVITWADMEYPSVNTKKLSKKERNLAKNRNAEIKKFLAKEDKDAKVTLYNMAERPGIFQEWLNTSDARVKKSLEVAGVPNTDTSVKSPSKASKAMVMAILKQ